MAVAKIEFSLAGLKFAGEGEEDWVTKQLDKILEAAPNLSKLQLTQAPSTPGLNQPGSASPADVGPLATYLKSKGAESNQVLRFLVTADWLRRRGNTKLATSAVTKALAENHQNRLSNPANCLNQNVAKGFCEKAADGFFITPEGLKSLGYTA